MLDNPAWHSLTGPHASFAIGDDLVRQYPADVAPFVAVRTWDDPTGLGRAGELVGPGAEIGLSSTDDCLPRDGRSSAAATACSWCRPTRCAPVPMRRRSSSAPPTCPRCSRSSIATSRPVPPAHVRTGPLHRHPPRRKAHRDGRRAAHPGAGPRSAPSRPMRSIADRVWLRGSSSTSPSTFRSAVTGRCCTPPRRMWARSPCTSGSASPCAAARLLVRPHPA